MIHRHLDYQAGTPAAELGAAALDDLLDRGDLDDWRPLARAVDGQPWGQVAETVLRLCSAHRMGGTSRLWPAFIAECRAGRLGAGGAAWPKAAPPATLESLRVAAGLSQAELGSRMAMNQSEVSKLESRPNPGIRTLQRVVLALGLRLHLIVEGTGDRAWELAATVEDDPA